MKYLIKDNFFVSSDGQKLRFIRTELIEDQICINKQCASIKEYEKTHVKEEIDEDTLYIMNDFQCFITKNLIANNINGGVVLDIWCGSYRKIPPYFRDLGNNKSFQYVGLDPMEFGEMERDYLFINGKFEGISNYLSHRFDFLIFSTSLDHFKDLELVKKEIRTITHKKSLVFFWVGLHDPKIAGLQAVANFFRKRLNIEKFFNVLKNIFFIPAKLFLLYFQMKKRKSKLTENIPLDDLHFHYFTEKSLVAFLSTLVDIVDIKKNNLYKFYFCCFKAQF